jgi:hypothetical protein
MMILEEQFIAKKAAVDADLLSLVNDSSTLDKMIFYVI